MHLLLAGHVLATTVLADDSNGPSAALGLVVTLALGLACIVLFRSMNMRIKRLPASFDPPPVDPVADATAAAEVVPPSQ